MCFEILVSGFTVITGYGSEFRIKVVLVSFFLLFIYFFKSETCIFPTNSEFPIRKTSH